MIKVLKPGFSSTIQDAGRTGYQQYGIIVSGVMDQVAFRIGNALLNQTNKAAIEMTLIGGTFQFTKQTTIVLTGGTIYATLNNKSIPMYKPITIHAGDLLTCGAIRNGARSYLCIVGGFNVATVLGSKSTYLKAKLGGLEGRALKVTDEVPYNDSTTHFTKQYYTPNVLYQKQPIRILTGTEWNELSVTDQKLFLEQTYTISLEADRMGYRLHTPRPTFFEKPIELLSEAVTFGTIQLPPSGQPIILMADRQTTGGYPKIGQVITADLPRLAQLPPTQTIQFQVVTLEQAEAAYARLEKHLQLLELIRC
ncbi:MAG: biotin-dependent carboxyltransferase family protein [Solibacillus sp.]|uniref:5-oxoprolinase subunit C family protein n=1 Tax=Solibacillus sp. TaxID=1909654 RepID=UPI00331539B2